MSGNESVGEELVELGIELVNPGGRPEELRQAAKAWRRLQKEVAGADGLLKALDKSVENVVGDTWRGPAAEAFRDHWREMKAQVEKATAQYDEIAAQLDEAADSIEKINEEIHDIYIEIGVSIGVGVALSFVTLGLGSAAAAANVARLAGQAISLSDRLGRLLRGIAAAMRAYQRSTKLAKLLVDCGLNWAGNSFTTVAGAAATGKGVDGSTLYQAAWQGGVASVVGTPLGMAGAGGATALLRNRGMSQLGQRAAESAAGGVVGNVAGGVAVDGVTRATGGKPEWLKNAVVNTAGGGVGGAGGVGIGAAAHHRLQATGNAAPAPTSPDPARPPAAGRQDDGPRPAAGATRPSGSAAPPPPNPPAPRPQRDIRDDFG
ncbi:WXG100 family type VII secretion target [Streptomyces sp. NPDC054887]